MLNDPILIAQRVENDRKKTQIDNQDDLERDLDDIKEEIKANEGHDIERAMVKER